MPEFQNLRTVKQIAEADGSAFTEGSLRWLIFNAQDNGLEDVLIRQVLEIARKVSF